MIFFFFFFFVSIGLPNLLISFRTLMPVKGEISNNSIISCKKNENLLLFWKSLIQYSQSLSDCNGTRIHNHLVCKRTLNHLTKLAKWLSCVVGTYPYGAFDRMILLCQARALIHSRFTLTRVRGMIRTNGQMHRTNKYSQHNSII